ncbi:MAG: ArnT family glycosyltransferase [Prevotella sp.]
MRKIESSFLYVGIVVVLLPLLLMRDFTPLNELRYLSIAEEALRNHVFFAFTNHGVPYADKPPLYLWIVMLCRYLVGSHCMWLLSLASLLPAMGVLLVMNGWTAQELDREHRLLAQTMLCSTGLFLVTAVVLRMDMLMTFFIVLSLRYFWKLYTAEGNGCTNGLLFPVFVFLAIFSKGPMGLLIPLCSSTVFLVATGRIRNFGHYWGWRTWGILGGCCLLWFAVVYAEGGTGYLYNLLFHQTFGRAVNAFKHASPFYFYALCLWYCLAPWCLLFVGTLCMALRPGFVRSELQCLFLCVAVSTLVLLSCFSSKLPVYMLPAVPFIVYAVAMFLPRFQQKWWLRLSLALPALLFMAVLPCLFLVVRQGRWAWLDRPEMYVGATILSMTGFGAVSLLCRRGRSVDSPRVVRRMACGLLVSLFAVSWSLPWLNARIGYGAMCSRALEISHAKGISEYRSWHLSRPENMDIYLHSPVKAIANEDSLAAEPRPFLLLTRRGQTGCFKGQDSHVVGAYAVVVFP